jgi:hypothetical protein
MLKSARERNVDAQIVSVMAGNSSFIEKAATKYITRRKSIKQHRHDEKNVPRPEPINYNVKKLLFYTFTKAPGY